MPSQTCWCRSRVGKQRQAAASLPGPRPRSRRRGGSCWQRLSSYSACWWTQWGSRRRGQGPAWLRRSGRKSPTMTPRVTQVPLAQVTLPSLLMRLLTLSVTVAREVTRPTGPGCLWNPAYMAIGSAPGCFTGAAKLPWHAGGCHMHSAWHRSWQCKAICPVQGDSPPPPPPPPRPFILTSLIPHQEWA